MTNDGVPPAKCHPRASQHALGLVLSSGEGEDVGIPQDEKRALELFKSAVKGELLFSLCYHKTGFNLLAARSRWAAYKLSVRFLRTLVVESIAA